jgi:phosphopantetheinyl transferase
LEALFWDFRRLTERDFLFLEEKLLPKEKAQFSSITDPKRGQEFLASRFLVRFFLKTTFPDGKNQEWSLHPDGKPYFEKGPFFNLSHGNGLVLAAFSARGEVGVDVQKEREGLAFQKILTRYGHSSEASLSEEEFFKFWVVKECYSKFIGRGLSPFLKEVRIDFAEDCVLGATRERLMNFALFQYEKNWMCVGFDPALNVSALNLYQAHFVKGSLKKEPIPPPKKLPPE